MAKKEKKQYLFQRRLEYKYPVITRGKGIYLYDESGKEYIDAACGAVVANLGHGLNKIASRVRRLAGRFSYLHGSQFTAKDMEEYAKSLIKIAPKDFSRVLFVSGGSEAVETAVKMAVQYHYDSGNSGKCKIVYRKPAYHGSTILASSLSSKENVKKPYEKLMLRFPSLPSPFCYRCPFGKNYPDCGIKCAKELEEVVKRENPGTIAAFIAEPVIGSSAGCVVPPPEYFPIIRKICDKYDILLIFDEIMAGFGRTGRWFASEHFNCQPDITIVGKGIGAGIVPLAAAFCTEKIVKTMQNNTGNFLHGFTFENNPFTMGVGKLVFDYMQEDDLVGRCRDRGKYLLAKLNTLRDIDIVGDVRGLGLMMAVEFVQDKGTKKPFSRKNQLAETIVQSAMKKGLNLYFSTGFVSGDGDAVMITPPFITSEKEIDKIVAILRETILEVHP